MKELSMDRICRKSYNERDLYTIRGKGMTLQQLKYLVTVAECGSISEAAQKLFISQPSLSAAIQNLEKEMGVTAFSRSSKGVVITREGEELLAYSRMLLEQAELNPEVDFQCAIDPGICSNVDITLMSRLVENLITNACKFGGKHVKVGLYEEDGQIYLFVRDDGIGISPENQKKVWDRFWQAEPSRSDNRQGSNGLGLSMVREIAKLHRGEMSLQSAPRQGSTFTLKMPKEE